MKEDEDFDEFITHAEIDFTGSGLQVDSIIRLGFLTVLPRRTILGEIGSFARERHERLLLRLAKYHTHIGHFLTANDIYFYCTD